MTTRRDIWIAGGVVLETGDDLPRLLDGTGWTAVESAADGSVTVGAIARGAEHARYEQLSPSALLRNNPRLLLGQEVSHPDRAIGRDSGWIVEGLEGRRSVVLARDGVQEHALVDDVVRRNIAELGTRIRVMRDS